MLESCLSVSQRATDGGQLPRENSEALSRVKWSNKSFGGGKNDGLLLSQSGRRAVGDKRLPILYGQNAWSVLP